MYFIKIIPYFLITFAGIPGWKKHMKISSEDSGKIKKQQTDDLLRKENSVLFLSLFLI